MGTLKKITLVAALLCSWLHPALSPGQDEPLVVAVGREFTITLESNPSTGYQWQLAKPLDGEIVKRVGSEYQAPETKLLGAPGKEVWTFKGVGPGSTAIELNYLRPWEKNMPPVASRTFRVVVRK
jgi:inhibitor of cysteine peptidase